MSKVSPAGMEIRQATPDDAEAISALVQELGPACMEDFGPQGLANFLMPNTPDKTRERLQREDSFSLVCASDTRLVGIITIKQYRKIDQLFVARDYWRCGIATRLWLAALDRIKANEQTDDIHVRSSTAGVPVYQRFGFKIVGEKGFVNDIFYYPMILTLDENADDNKN